MEKIGVINGLRGFAILAVIYQHIFAQIYTYPGWYYFNIFGYPVLPFTCLSNGWVGVNLFFILSGFVLFLPFVNNFRVLNSGRDFISFYKRRAGRLLPLYYISIFVTIFFIGNFTRDPQLPKDAFLMGTVTFGFTKGMWYPKYNDVLWSLGVEIWFSVLFPFLVIIGKKTGILKLFIFTSVLSLAVRFIGVNFDYFEIDHQYLNIVKDSLFGRLDDFVLGMLICSLYFRKEKMKIRIAPRLYFFLGIIFIMSACMLWDYKILKVLPAGFTPLINNIIQIGFFLIIISLLNLEKGALKFIFTNLPIQVMGMMCYSLYIWHRIGYHTILEGEDYNYFNMAAYFVLLFSISIFTYRYVEFGKKSVREIFLLRPKETPFLKNPLGESG